jgi:hypothetical protein
MAIKSGEKTGVSAVSPLTEQRAQAQTEAPSARKGRRIAGRETRVETGRPAR